MRVRMQIERPGGKVEEVIAETPLWVDYETFKSESKRQTREAGRGEILSFEKVAPPLKKQRKLLVSDMNLWIETAQLKHRQAISRGEKPETEASEKAEKAVQALREFDAGHPEIKAELDREEKEKTEKLMQRWV